MNEELCHCGKPLHYSNKKIEAFVKRTIEAKGPSVPITVGEQTWLVPRHYLALHGIKAWELPNLGFPRMAEHADHANRIASQQEVLPIDMDPAKNPIAVTIQQEPDDPICARASIGGTKEIGYYLVFRGDPIDIILMLDRCIEAFKEHVSKGAKFEPGLRYRPGLGRGL